MPRSLFSLAFLLTFLPQLLLAVAAPALVLCQERSGAQVVELSLADCCAPDDVHEAESGAERAEGPQLSSSSEDDCAGCEDGAVVVTAQPYEEGAPIDLGVSDCASSEPAQGALRFPRRERARAPPRPDRLPPALRALKTLRLRC